MNQHKIEQFALSNFLSEYPDDTPYEKVLDLIYESDQSVVIWEPFECYTPEWVVEHIEEMVLNLNHWFKEDTTA